MPKARLQQFAAHRRSSQLSVHDNSPVRALAACHVEPQCIRLTRGDPPRAFIHRNVASLPRIERRTVRIARPSARRLLRVPRRGARSPRGFRTPDRPGHRVPVAPAPHGTGRDVPTAATRAAPTKCRARRGLHRSRLRIRGDSGSGRYPRSARSRRPPAARAISKFMSADSAWPRWR